MAHMQKHAHTINISAVTVNSQSIVQIVIVIVAHNGDFSAASMMIAKSTILTPVK